MLFVPLVTSSIEVSGLLLGPRTRGLAIAHLNIPSRLNKMDHVNIIMGDANSFDISLVFLGDLAK